MLETTLQTTLKRDNMNTNLLLPSLDNNNNNSNNNNNNMLTSDNKELVMRVINITALSNNNTKRNINERYIFEEVNEDESYGYQELR